MILRRDLVTFLVTLLTTVALTGLPANAAKPAPTLSELLENPPQRDYRATLTGGLGYGGGSGDLYSSSEAGLAFQIGAGIPVSAKIQTHLMVFLHRIGRTGNAPTVNAYGFDILWGTPYRAVTTGRSHGFIEGGLGFLGNAGYGKNSDVTLVLRGGTLIAVGEGKALQIAASLRPSAFVILNMLGPEERTGILMSVDVGFIF